MLDRMKDVLPKRHLTSNEKEELITVSSGCYKVLEELQEMLQKYEVLASQSKQSGFQIRRQWKKLEWEPENMKELQSRVILNTGLLDTYNSQTFV